MTTAPCSPQIRAQPHPSPIGAGEDGNVGPDHDGRASLRDVQVEPAPRASRIHAGEVAAARCDQDARPRERDPIRRHTPRGRNGNPRAAPVRRLPENSGERPLVPDGPSVLRVYRIEVEHGVQALPLPGRTSVRRAPETAEVRARRTDCIALTTLTPAGATAGVEGDPGPEPGVPRLARALRPRPSAVAGREQKASAARTAGEEAVSGVDEVDRVGVDAQKARSGNAVPRRAAVVSAVEPGAAATWRCRVARPPTDEVD